MRDYKSNGIDLYGNYHNEEPLIKERINIKSSDTEVKNNSQILDESFNLERRKR